MNIANDLVERLHERTALKYIGDCKCGKCQLVPRELIDEAAARIEELEAALAWYGEQSRCVV